MSHSTVKRDTERQPARRKRNPPGVHIGAALVRWLGSIAEDDPAYIRITTIIKLLCSQIENDLEFEHHSREEFENRNLRQPSKAEVDQLRLVSRYSSQWEEMYEQREAMREELNRHLAYFSGGFTGLLSTHQGRAFFRLYRKHPSRKEQEEWDKLNAVLELAKQGLIQRVRRCEYQPCRKWFYAISDAHTSCRKEHRIGKYRTTEKYRERHRQQERNRYYSRKALEQGKKSRRRFA